ncbi:MAG: MFS transporter [bacterium]|nr:MFS transporter [bacterium]MCP5065794.1 MFS transporter [bacterium]
MPEGLSSRAFWFCFWVNMLQGIAFNLFLHFPGYLHDLGAGDAEIGWISGITAMAAIVLRPPIGRAMDRHGRRPVILVGGLLNAAVVGLYLAVESIGPALYVIRVLHGLAEAMLFSSLFTYAADQVPARNRTQGLAWFGISGMLPMAIGGVLGDGLLGLEGQGAARFDALFQVAFGLALLSLLVSLALPEAWQARRAANGATDPPGGLRAALRQPELGPLWLIGGAFSIAVTALFVFTRRFVDETGIGSVGSFFTAYTVAALFLRVFFGWLPDRIGPKRVLLPALLALAAGFLWLGQATVDRDVVIGGVLCGIGHGYAFPILFGLVVSRTPEANRGMAMAVFTALFDVGVLTGGPFFGLWIERSGFSAMFLAAALITLAGTLVFYSWDGRVLDRKIE